MSEESTALVAPTDDAIAGLRKLGRLESQRVAAIQELRSTIAGLTWGDVQGTHLSKQTQHAIASICHLTGANPVLHLDMLGGKPYFKAAFWEDKINSEIRFHHYEQRELSPFMEQALRERAAEYEGLAGELEGNEAAKAKLRALELREEADEIALARAKYSPRETATSVVETTIYRFINAAPMEKIMAGEITDLEPWLVTVTECNWAGGMGDSMKANKKWDPVGDANPGTTARTRSLRRCAVKAFSATMAAYSEQMEKIERIIEADWEVLTSDEEGALVLDDRPTVTYGSGDPQAGNPTWAVDLPIEGEGPGEPGEPEPNEEEEEEPVDDFDRADYRARLFATLKDAGVTEKGRKKWQEDNDLPDSVTKFTKDDFDRALEVLYQPVIEKVTTGCESLGQDLSDLSLVVLGKNEPEYLKDWKELAEVLRKRIASNEI